jgi:hypothetical protein
MMSDGMVGRLCFFAWNHNSQYYSIYPQSFANLGNVGFMFSPKHVITKTADFSSCPEKHVMKF